MNDNHTPDNNTPSDEWESEMSDEFERRVRDLHEAPLSLAAVKGKAMNIRAKRRAAVAGGILAAAAVIVPVAALANNGTDKADDIPPATSTPSVSITDTPAPPPSETPTTPATSAPTVPDDASLGFDYLELDPEGQANAVLHERDGGVIELPRADYNGAADLGGVVAAYRYDQTGTGNGSVDIITDGAVTKTYDARSGMVITPTSSAVSFITTDGELLVVNADGDQSLGTDFATDLFPGAIIGTGDCVDEAGCHPFINDGTGKPAFEINYEGPNTDTAGGKAYRVNDATDDWLVTVQTKSTDTGSCGGLYDRSAQAFRFETCKAQVLDISPTGDHVIGTSPYGDGLGPNYFSILDGQTGDEVARYTAEQGFVNSMAWADETHAVATVYENGDWYVISLDATDGSSEVLQGPLAGDEASAPVVLTGGS